MSVSQASRVKWGPKVKKVLWDFKGAQESGDQMDYLDLQDKLDHQERKVFLVWMGSLV